MKNKALEYADNVIAKKIIAPKYVKKQCKDFKKVLDGKDKKYIFDEHLFVKICCILKMLRMAKGPKAGKIIYNSLAGYQWLLITATLCIKYRDDMNRRRYTKAVLEIGKKNGKTFVIALIFLLLYYTEPDYAKFYSVAPDGSLSREIKDALEPLLKINAEVFERGEFVIRRDYIEHTPNNIKFNPLNYSNSRLEAREPSVFIVDEAGALPNSYAISIMEAGQLMVKNPLGFVISTKYPEIDNPFEDEVDNSKKILDGVRENEEVFSLLYEPDQPKRWEMDNNVVLQANPLALEDDEVKDRLFKDRQEAIERESKRETFLTKHCNIIYQSANAEQYIQINDLRKCKVEHIDWAGRIVYLGADLAQTTDNTAIAMVAYDNGKILSKTWAFIPADRIAEKTKEEKVDYQRYINSEDCFGCGDLVVDYSFIEDFVFAIEEKYGVSIGGIGFDRYNAMSSAQKWDEKYTTCEVRQGPMSLHPPTKLVREKILSEDFEYEDNGLFEINMQNAKCELDKNLNMMLSKKKSRGKIDMGAALMDAVFLMQQNEILDAGGFVAMTL